MDNENINGTENQSNESKKESKKKIIPSYSKKKVDEKKVRKSNDKKKRKLIFNIIFFIICLVLIGLAIYGVIALINYNKYKPYRAYEEKMKTYGFDKAYNNESAKTGESITKSEAIKMILAACFNTNDISGFAADPNKEYQYDNEIWVDYAVYRNIVDSSYITKENENEKIPYIDVIRFLATAKTKLLDKELDSAVQLKVKDIDKYKSDEQVAIEDMIQNEIIKVNTKKIKGDKYIFKGQMNELISNFVEKYNTITVNGEKINISEDKKPSNKDEYPYTLASVDKSVYEIENYKFIEDVFTNAKDTYSLKKDYYPQIESKINKYFDTILNVDYNTIDKDTFIDNINSLMLYGVNNDSVEEYINYVKNNKIIISGKATVNFPAVYFDGRTYRVRTTIEIDLSKCKTNKNIFYGDDLEGNNEYDLSKTKMVLDVPMGESIDSQNLSIFNGSIHNWIAGNVIYEM